MVTRSPEKKLPTEEKPAFSLHFRPYSNAPIPGHEEGRKEPADYRVAMKRSKSAVLNDWEKVIVEKNSASLIEAYGFELGNVTRLDYPDYGGRIEMSFTVKKIGQIVQISQIRVEQEKVTIFFAENPSQEFLKKLVPACTSLASIFGEVKGIPVWAQFEIRERDFLWTLRWW